LLGHLDEPVFGASFCARRRGVGDALPRIGSNAATKTRPLKAARPSQRRQTLALGTSLLPLDAPTLATDMGGDGRWKFL
jgi:hypothetical protein